MRNQLGHLEKFLLHMISNMISSMRGRARRTCAVQSNDFTVEIERCSTTSEISPLARREQRAASHFLHFIADYDYIIMSSLGNGLKALRSYQLQCILTDMFGIKICWHWVLSKFVKGQEHVFALWLVHDFRLQDDDPLDVNHRAMDVNHRAIWQNLLSKKFPTKVTTVKSSSSYEQGNKRGGDEEMTLNLMALVKTSEHSAWVKQQKSAVYAAFNGAFRSKLFDEKRCAGSICWLLLVTNIICQK